MVKTNGPLWNLYQDLKGGEITRQQFLRRATALGMGMPVALFVLSAVKLAGAAAQDAVLPARPSVGTEHQTRGAGGELKLLQREGPTLANAHNSTAQRTCWPPALSRNRCFPTCPIARSFQTW